MRKIHDHKKPLNLTFFPQEQHITHVISFRYHFFLHFITVPALIFTAAHFNNITYIQL